MFVCFSTTHFNPCIAVLRATYFLFNIITVTPSSHLLCEFTFAFVCDSKIITYFGCFPTLVSLVVKTFLGFVVGGARVTPVGFAMLAFVARAILIAGAAATAGVSTSSTSTVYRQGGWISCVICVRYGTTRYQIQMIGRRKLILGTLRQVATFVEVKHRNRQLSWHYWWGWAQGLRVECVHCFVVFVVVGILFTDGLHGWT